MARGKPIFVGDFQIDVTTSESHHFPAQVTKKPVERGADTADHVHLEPIQVKIDGIVSDTPIGDLALSRATSSNAPSTDALDYLTRLRETREVFTLETDLQVYDNMVVADLEVPRDASSGDALQFSATFEQIRITEIERVQIRTTSARGQKKVNLGSQPTIAAEPPIDWSEVPQSVTGDGVRTRVRPDNGWANPAPKQSLRSGLPGPRVVGSVF